MKITIIPSANVVIIDGQPESVSYTGESNIHAIHWDTVSKKGEVEYTDMPNVSIKTFGPYQRFIADHAASKSARAQAVIDAEDAKQAGLDAQQAARDAAELALTPTQRREREYPLEVLHLHALYLARQGDSTALNAIDAAYAIIDTKYPL